MIISFINEKGGSGKTTLAVNLAVWLANKGEDVVLVDADPQQSATAFSELRGEDLTLCPVPTFSKAGQNLDKDILSLSQKYKYVIIDTGGRDSVEARKAMLVSDKMIIPVNPSQFTIWALEKVLRLFGEARDFNTKLEALMVMNNVTTNTFMQDAGQLSTFLNERKEDAEGAFLLEGYVYSRAVYEKMVRFGKSVFESDNEKAISECAAFCEQAIILKEGN